MSEEWVEVFVTYDTVEADIIKELLESGGISVVLRSAKGKPVSGKYREDGRGQDSCEER